MKRLHDKPLETGLIMNSQTYRQDHFKIADHLEISEVMDCRTGEYFGARDIIGTSRERFFILRNEIVAAIHDNRPLYRCAICHVPVKLIAPFDKGAHFRHELEDGRCPALTRGQLNEREIRALKYNGAKESEPHKAIKGWLAASLRADPNFTSVETEARWNNRDRSAWRQPDVQALFKGIRVAFEIQLSTTFLDVIVERREFYRKEGGLLFWVFREFPAEDRRMTLEDVFYNNNRNAFIVSEDTAKQSQQSARFCLECRWIEPIVSSAKIEEYWQRGVIGFDELTLDTQNQRAWRFDCDQARQDCQTLMRRQLISSCKAAIRDFSIKAMDESFGYEDRVKVWCELQRQFDAVGLTLPSYDGGDRFRKLMCFLFSIEEGKPVGFKFQKLVQVGHYTFDNHKSLLWVFGFALKTYKRAEQMLQEDTTQKWRQRIDVNKGLINEGVGEFRQEFSYNSIIAALFPELASKIG